MYNLYNDTRVYIVIKTSFEFKEVISILELPITN